MGKVIEFPSVAENEKFHVDAGEISGMMAEVLQKECIARNIAPAEAIGILVVLMGRMAGRYHNRALTLEQVWSTFASEEYTFPFFEMGFKNELKG